MKRIDALTIILLCFIIFCGCIVTDSQGNRSAFAKDTSLPSAMPTQSIVKIVEDEINVQPPEHIAPPYGVVPDFYVELKDYGWAYPIYAFLDKDGVVQYRAYVDITTYYGTSLYRFDRGFVKVNFDYNVDGSFAPLYSFDMNPKFIDDTGMAATEYDSGNYYPRNDDGTPCEGAVPIIYRYDSSAKIMYEYLIMENGHRVEVNSYAKFIEESTPTPTIEPTPTTAPESTPVPTSTSTPAPTAAPTTEPTEIPTSEPTPEVVETPTPEETAVPINTVDPTQDP